MSGRKPRFLVPAGATDTHIHIYLDSIPSAPGGPPLPGHFPVEKYREIQRRLTRGGIVAQRIFQLPWGAVGFERVHEVMSQVHPFGWHANVQLYGLR